MHIFSEVIVMTSVCMVQSKSVLFEKSLDITKRPIVEASWHGYTDATPYMSIVKGDLTGMGA
jgi:hypothetical protein